MQQATDSGPLGNVRSLGNVRPKYLGDSKQ